MSGIKTVLVHYNAPPVAGGVEQVLWNHSRLFGMHGDAVVVCGNGDRHAFDPEVECVRLEELNLQSPRVQAAMADLEGEPFLILKDRIKELLRDICADADFVVGHNVFTMPFHLPLTRAMVELVQEMKGTRFIAWVHDVGVCHPHLRVPEGGLWDVIRHAHPNVLYVAVSDLRRRQVLEVLGAPECLLAPNGVQLFEFLNITSEVADLAENWELIEADMVLLCPVRILRRKNLELAVGVIAELVARQVDARLVITGAPDRYNPDSQAYEREVRRLVEIHRVADRVCFVHEFFRATQEDVRSFYQMSDALLFCSSQEGFGLPMLEAALTKLPIFCADIEPLRSIFEAGVTLFSPSAEPAEVAALVLQELSTTPSSRRFREVLRKYEAFTQFRSVVEPVLGLGEERLKQ